MTNVFVIVFLVGALIGVALLEIGALAATLLAHQYNGTQDEHFRADANEGPEGGQLVLDTNIGLAGYNPIAWNVFAVTALANVVAAI